MPVAPVVLLRTASTSLRGNALACGIALSTVQGILAEQGSPSGRGSPAWWGELNCPGACAARMPMTAPSSRGF